MSKEKKGRRWDGKSRVSTELYRRRFNEIFKKEKTTSKNTNKSSNSSQKSGVSTNFHLSEKEKKEIIELDKKIKLAKEALKEREEAGPLNFKINAEIVNGTCPHCNLETVLVCLWQGNIYRCMGCGYDVEQKVNGKISYIPHVNDPDNFQYRMKVDTDGK